MKKKAALDAIKTIRGGLDALEDAIKAPTPKKRTTPKTDTVKKKKPVKKKKKRKVGPVDSAYTYNGCMNGVERCGHVPSSSGRCGHGGSRC